MPQATGRILFGKDKQVARKKRSGSEKLGESRKNQIKKLKL
jgi:hypothetical protein